jgi:hypothetical protein
MRNFVILLAVLLSTAVSASETDSSEVQQGFLDLFPASPVACPDSVPKGCACGKFENRTELPMRYTRVQACPHPVLEGVRNMKTFTADGATIDDAMLKNGQLHGAAISWHPNGRVEGIANYEEGRQIGFARVWHDNGTLFAEQRFVDGESHGMEIRYSRDGSLETLMVWDHGDVDREETRRISRAHGLEAPFDRARSAGSQEDEESPD